MTEEKYGELHWKREAYQFAEDVDGGSKTLIINQRHSKMYLVTRQKMTLLCEAVIP